MNTVASTYRSPAQSGQSVANPPRNSLNSPLPSVDPSSEDARAKSTPAPRNLRRWWALFAVLPFVTSVAGCGLVAAPCRVASAGLKIVPGVGGVLAAPTDACAAVID
ncbi:hypothetical protein AT302_09885 [Pandoraea norimbergensis]|uniref:Lipoprotein n=1 Tax=Pandoraea norimbergensis TaxID=93219 RepID=A0ABM5WHZ8_9BURK|nr:hypothetical protein AT302_09885 [Pandoraea norimbergensis]